MGQITRIEMDYMEAVKRIAREMSKPKEIDWEQRRYEIAKDILAAKAARSWGQGDIITERNVRSSVDAADLLIEELKKPKKSANVKVGK